MTSPGANFSFKSRPFSEGLYHPEKLTRSQKVVSFCKNGGKTWRYTHTPKLQPFTIYEISVASILLAVVNI